MFLEEEKTLFSLLQIKELCRYKHWVLYFGGIYLIGGYHFCRAASAIISAYNYRLTIIDIPRSFLARFRS